MEENINVGGGVRPASLVAILALLVRYAIGTTTGAAMRSRPTVTGEILNIPPRAREVSARISDSDAPRLQQQPSITGETLKT